jgi:phage shock protein C
VLEAKQITGKAVSQMSDKRFARSKNVQIFGVCAGLAEYTGIPVTIMRVLWILVALFTQLGLAFLAYIILAFVMAAPEGAPENQRFWHNVDPKKIFNAFCVALICIGSYMIITSILQFDLNRYLFPIGLILTGILLMSLAFRKKDK